MFTLSCVDCPSAVETDLVEFDDMPIAEWWASKGERCARCRRRAAAGRRPVQVRAPKVPRDVRAVLLAAGGQGATYDELCRALALPYVEVAAQVAGLIGAGLAESAPFTRRGNAGLDQEVWTMKEKA